MILDFPITYRKASVICQLECPCLYTTVKSFIFKNDENADPKGR